MKATRQVCGASTPEFDLRRTLESGQVFHAMSEGDGWQILVDRTPLYAEQRGIMLRVPASHEESSSKIFLARSPSGSHIRGVSFRSFQPRGARDMPGSPHSQAAKWECLATFITSPMKQVAHIRQISLHLRALYGEKIPGSRVNAYPSAHRLAQTTEKELRECRLGFRAKNLLGAANVIASGEIDLGSLANKPTAEARKQLCLLPGVGRKVANCVLLFAYERLDAVPVDVWIARILRAMHKKTSSLLELEQFSNRRFGSYAGYIQQYLFHHARMSKTLPA